MPVAWLRIEGGSAVPYQSEFMAEMEAGYQLFKSAGGQPTISFKLGDTDYIIDFRSMEQINTTTLFSRRLLRTDPNAPVLSCANSSSTGVAACWGFVEIDFVPYSEEISEQVERAFSLHQQSKGPALCTFTVTSAKYPDGVQYDVDFNQMKQLNRRTSFSREVVRKSVAPAAEAAPACAFEGLNTETNFLANRIWMDKALVAVSKNTDLAEIKEIAGPPAQETVRYVSALLPVHRLSMNVFRNVLAEGGLRSRASQRKLRGQAPAVSANWRLRKHPAVTSLLRDWMVQIHKCTPIFKFLEVVVAFELEKDDDKKTELEAGIGTVRDCARKVLAEATGRSDRDPQQAVEELTKLAKQVATKVSTAETGINYPTDKKLGTDEHVFAILGPLQIDYGEVCLVLKREVMHHPDFNCSITAATSFFSLRSFWHRPWAILGKIMDHEIVDADGTDCADTADLKVDDLADVMKVLKTTPDGVSKEVDFSSEMGAEYFHKSTLHPIVPKWEFTLARELEYTARLFFLDKRRHDRWDTDECKALRAEKETYCKADVGPALIRNWYSTIDSHGAIECHLPAFVPLDFVEKMWISKKALGKVKDAIALYDNLPGGSLKDRLEVIDSEGDFNDELLKRQTKFFEQRACVGCASAKAPVSSLGSVDGFSFALQELNGEERYLPAQLLEDSKGCVLPSALRFVARGQHLRITLSTKPVQTRNVAPDEELQLFLIVIGAVQNQVTYIKNDNRAGKGELAKITVKESVLAMANPTGYKEYWISIDPAGRLAVGTGLLGEGEILCVEGDVIRHTKVRHIGVSCWESPVHFKDFTLHRLSKPEVDATPSASAATPKAGFMPLELSSIFDDIEDTDG